MMNFKPIINIICFILLISNTASCFALDRSINDHEDMALVRSNKPIVYVDGRSNGCEKCEKYLIKYDGINPLIKLLEKWSVEKFDTDNLKTISEKIGIGVVGLSALGLGIYFIPITTVLSTLGFSVSLPATCAAYKEIIDPTIKIAGFIPRAIIRYYKKSYAQAF